MMISAYEKLGGIVWIPRMIQKIRLRAEGKLSPEFLDNMGKGFDGRCVRFLGISYDELVDRVVKGATNDEVLAWILEVGSKPNPEQIIVWNEFMIKRGWRDTDQPPEKMRDYKQKYGLGHRVDILTYFDFYEVDEGRKT
jgi:gluconokinase